MINRLAPYLRILSIVLAFMVIVCCFLNWVYYPSIDEKFTGFYSKDNFYGKPGKFIIAFTTLFLIFTLLQKVWAKFTNFFVAGLLLAYVAKTYLLYSRNFGGYTPQVLWPLHFIAIACIIMMLSAIFPHMVIKK